MLRNLMGKVDNMQEQLSKMRREMESVGKNQKEMRELKNYNRNEECL